MGEMILVALVGAAFAFLIFFVISQKGKIRRSFEGFAQAHGLQYHHGRYPRVTGQVDGDRDFSMGSFMAVAPSGRRQVNLPPEFRMELGVRGTLPDGLETGRQGLLERGGIGLGDPAFEKKVSLTCADEAAAAAYLTPERREALIILAKMQGGLAGSRIWLRRSGFKPRQAWMDGIFKRVLDAAKVLDAG